MKRKNRVPLNLALLGGVYILLLVLLYLAEHGQPNSNINTFGDAVWYSIVTLSTVGYGDVTPKTTVGHVIGILFLLLSMGVLVTLMGTAFTFITGEAMPLYQLKRSAAKDWYYFTDFGAESDTLAKDILRYDENAVIIFGVRREVEFEIPEYPCFFLNLTPARIIAQKGKRGNPCRMFLMKENDITQNMKTEGLSKLPVQVYARTKSGRGSAGSKNIQFFHSYDCCARQYWRKRVFCRWEKEVVIIGFGRYGQAILERAILTNIFRPDQKVAYHVFGDAEAFKAMHPELESVFGIDREGEGDSIYFHTESWEHAHELIERADRIIICEDDEDNGWDILGQLQRYYAVRGKIDLRCSRPQPDISTFGTNEEIFCVDQILRYRINEAAIAMNDLYRKSSSGPTLSWEELDDRLQQSKIAAADHLLMKVRILLKDDHKNSLDGADCRWAYYAYCNVRGDADQLEMLRRIEHLRWKRYYAYHNWRYGETKNDERREHPMMTDFEQLSDEQKKYLDYAWELLNSLAKRLIG